jgi:hypothetical protein
MQNLRAQIPVRSFKVPTGAFPFPSNFFGSLTGGLLSAFSNCRTSRAKAQTSFLVDLQVFGIAVDPPPRDT